MEKGEIWRVFGCLEQVTKLISCSRVLFEEGSGKKTRGEALRGCVLTPSLLSRRPARGAKFLSVAVCEINLCVV